MATYLPIVRIDYGKYLIGTHEKHVQLLSKGVVVSTDEGLMELYDYLKYCAKSECNELLNLMRKGDGTFKNTVLGLLD